MKRRKFIGLLTAGAGLAAFGGYVFFEKFETIVRKIIIKDTLSLNVSVAEIDKYLAAARRNKHLISNLPLSNQQLLKWHYYLDSSWLTLPYNTKNTVDRSKIVGDFLLSTNFFANKMDASKPIMFISIYDPYQKPCSNPFSNLFYPQV